METTELLYLGGALLAGFVLGVVLLLVVQRAKRKPQTTPPPPARDDVVPLEVVSEADDKSGSQDSFDEDPHAAWRPPGDRPPTHAHGPADNPRAAGHGPAGQPPRAPPPPARAPPVRSLPPAPSNESEEHFGVAGPARAPPMPKPVMPADFEDSTVQTEWARRHVGPLEPGRVKGVCSGCGTQLSISKHRPLKIACPVCGRTRLLS